MTRHQIDRAVARATGESLRTVRRLGFTALPEEPADAEPDELCLVHDCPRCGHPVPYHGPTAPAACPGCELGFQPRAEMVYAAVPGTMARAAG